LNGRAENVIRVAAAIENSIQGFECSSAHNVTLRDRRVRTRVSTLETSR
jgi:hypothetical protein